MHKTATCFFIRPCYSFGF